MNTRARLERLEAVLTPTRDDGALLRAARERWETNPPSREEWEAQLVAKIAELPEGRLRDFFEQNL